MNDSTPSTAAARPFGSALVERVNDRAWIALLAALAIVPLTLRGPLPPDEVRYLSVAWEMWSRGDLVLPYLNGVPYTDKGPLLFWLMHAGWAVFGVNDWWPRLLPPLFALTAVLLTRALARTLWPADREIAAVVPWLLAGSLALTIYTQVVLVDLLLTCCTLLALLGMARAERGDAIGWLLVAAGTALGLLTKGPVMLLHLAGAALLAPWWRREGGSFAAHAWYPRVAAALGLGVGLALLWGLLAPRRAGSAYGTDVIVYQTAGRLVGHFAHRHGAWFYVVMLPVLLLPWSAWPRVWQGVRTTLRGGGLRDSGWRFASATIVPTFVVMSAIAVKQPHYLLPLVPLITCLFASALMAHKPQRSSARLPVVLAATVAAAMAVLPLLAGGRLSVEPWSPIPGLVAAAAMLPLLAGGATDRLVRRVALLAPVVVLSTEAAFFAANEMGYDASAAAEFVHTLQNEGHPVAYTRDYEGEFHFAGRLTEPIDVVGRDEHSALIWSQQHPDGYVVRYRDAPQPGAAYTQPLRGVWLSIEAVNP